MAKGSSRTSCAQLLGSLLASGVVAPLVGVAPFGLQAQAQEQEQPISPSSEQVDAPGTSEAEPAAEPQVLVSEVLVEGLAGHPCLLYTSPSPRDATLSRMPSSA